MYSTGWNRLQGEPLSYSTGRNISRVGHVEHLRGVERRGGVLIMIGSIDGGSKSCTSTAAAGAKVLLQLRLLLGQTISIIMIGSIDGGGKSFTSTAAAGVKVLLQLRLLLGQTITGKTLASAAALT